MPHLGGGGRRTPDGRRLEANPHLSLRALKSRATPGKVLLHDQGFPSAAMEMGSCPVNGEGMRVRTIAITAPQQVHRIGARCLTQAKV